MQLLPEWWNHLRCTSIGGNDCSFHHRHHGKRLRNRYGQRRTIQRGGNACIEPGVVAGHHCRGAFPAFAIETGKHSIGAAPVFCTGAQAGCELNFLWIEAVGDQAAFAAMDDKARGTAGHQHSCMKYAAPVGIFEHNMRPVIRPRTITQVADAGDDPGGQAKQAQRLIDEVRAKIRSLPEGPAQADYGREVAAELAREVAQHFRGIYLITPMVRSGMTAPIVKEFLQTK